MSSQYLPALIDRELRTLVRELEAYPDTTSLWARPAGLPNSAGTLALHLAGNLEHFFGAVLGGTGYRRDRDAEFATRDLPVTELLARVEQARRVVGEVLSRLGPQDLERDYPIAVAGCRLNSGDYVTHLAAHLAYHLGQIDYHRRLVTGSSQAVGAMAIRELGSARRED